MQECENEEQSTCSAQCTCSVLHSDIRVDRGSLGTHVRGGYVEMYQQNNSEHNNGSDNITKHPEQYTRTDLASW